MIDPRFSPPTFPPVMLPFLTDSSSPPTIRSMAMPTPTHSPSRSIKRDHDMMTQEDSALSIQAPDLVPQEMDTVGAQRVIDVLGGLLKQVKSDTWYKLLQQQNKTVHEIPTIPLLAINTFLYQVQEDATTPSDYHAADIYCSMTGFMAIYLALIQLVFHDLMGDSSPIANPFDDYMGLFACGDDVASSRDDLFTWYHWQHRPQLVADLQQRLQHVGCVQFRSLALIDTVLTRFYTTHLLQPVAQQHQKDHGQFYTPQSVVRFMWSLCPGTTTTTSPPPRVFDPCMGIGAFLCDYLTRLIDRTRDQVDLWNNGPALQTMLAQLPESIWGVEIDPFAFKLGKLNIMVHMFPLYQRCCALNNGPLPQGFSIGRLSLFRNDTLRLDLDANLYTTKDTTWEQQQLLRLRDPSQLVFDYIVTNPPYMIRKTGFLTDPDKALYDDRYLGGKGTQAYMYFLWFCLQRLHPVTGQLCFITPSQWTVLEFAGNLRKWIWENCRLLDLFQFEPYKVWNKVQTDSLIFRICKRQQDMDAKTSTYKHEAMFLRHLSRKATLAEILDDYSRFDRLHLDSQNPLIKYKFTSTDDLDLLHTTMHDSFAQLSPTSAVSDQLMELTRGYPSLCDDGSAAPLVWHRGPNTNPVYALVVRTQWALDTFGRDSFEKWLRPVIYWNGKSSASSPVRPSRDDPSGDDPSSSSTSTSSTAPINKGKEIRFWADRDSMRLTKKENSPAEAYVEFDGKTQGDDSFYSMILVDKEGAAALDKTSALYRYLHDARLALQPGQTDKELAWCHYNKCGVHVPVKLVHPINFGYFSRTQPRQRFFMDRHRRCVTNQCMYFTIKDRQFYTTMDKALTTTTTTTMAWENYYLGIVNSSIIQFFIRAHCYYDQQGRTRFFGKHMAKIPHAPPMLHHVDLMDSHITQLTAARRLIYAMIRQAEPLRSVMEKVRNCTWDLSPVDRQRLEQVAPSCAGGDGELEILVRRGGGTLADQMVRLLIVQSLLQYAVDHLAYQVYGIPLPLQSQLEQELGLSLTLQWQCYQHLLQGRTIRDVVNLILIGELIVE